MRTTGTWPPGHVKGDHDLVKFGCTDAHPRWLSTLHGPASGHAINPHQHGGLELSDGRKACCHKSIYHRQHSKPAEILACEVISLIEVVARPAHQHIPIQIRQITRFWFDHAGLTFDVRDS